MYLALMYCKRHGKNGKRLCTTPHFHSMWLANYEGWKSTSQHYECMTHVSWICNFEVMLVSQGEIFQLVFEFFPNILIQCLLRVIHILITSVENKPKFYEMNGKHEYPLFIFKNVMISNFTIVLGIQMKNNWKCW